MKPSISILIIDDQQTKREAIIAALKAHLQRFDVRFECAERYESARQKLQSRNYDFVILDIKLPAGEEDASEKWSRQLLRDIVSGDLCYPMHVFGMTQHWELADAERQYYEENMFGFFLFEWEKLDWAKAIASKIEYLAAAITNGAAYRLNSYDYDLLLLVARNRTEFEPIRRALFGSQRGTGHPLWPDRSYFGQLALGRKKKLRTAFLCVGETGLAAAATLTTQAIQVLRPRMVAMLGMCAGFETKGVKLLDVLVATEAACWQEGKSSGDEVGEKFDPTAKIKTSSPTFAKQVNRYMEMYSSELSSVLQNVCQLEQFEQLRKTYQHKIRRVPKVFAGLVVSGSEVVASKKTRSEVMRRYTTALGLEMEIYAVYVAALHSLGRSCEFIAIKGVADFADPGRAQATQSFASHLSAEVLLYFLKKAARTGRSGHFT